LHVKHLFLVLQVLHSIAHSFLLKQSPVSYSKLNPSTHFVQKLFLS